LKDIFDNIFNILPVFIGRWGKFKYIYTGLFLRKVAYTTYAASWFLEDMDFRNDKLRRM
jgi:hypothetical protein